MEGCLAALDNGKFGLCFASGMGAITSVIALLNSGEHIISSDDIYGGTNVLFNKIITRFNIETTFVDTSVPSNVEDAIKPNTKARSILHLHTLDFFIGSNF